MTRKTSQLQIRVTPEQKAAVRRLADEVGLTVSQYVLAAVLPPARAEFSRLARDLRDPAGRGQALQRLRSYLDALSAEELRGAVSSLDLAETPPYLQNYLAALVEQAARAKRVSAPPWTGRVPPLDRPHFASDVRSLWPHLIRITPAAFKRRNVFVDADGVERRAVRART